MTKEKKFGFAGQWVDGTPIGKHVDSDGDEVNIDVAFLEAVVRNYDPKLHEAPAVIGHPKTDAPAFGHVVELRVNNGRLERRFSEVNPEFEELVKTGAYKKRSDAFYLDPKIAPGGKAPYLRHVGFLGAQPPAIKGIQDIHFSEDDAKSKTVDAEVDTEISFSEGEDMTDSEKKAMQEETRKGVIDYLKEKLGIGKEEKIANFSEADAQTLIDGAVKPLTEKIASLEAENKKLLEGIDAQSGASKRGEVTAFFESLQTKGILPPALKTRVVNFMEALAGVPDKKVTVIEFAEDGKTEKKIENSLLVEFQEFIGALPPYIQFGEQYRGLHATGDGSALGDPKQREAMRAEMGLKTEAKK